MNFILRLIWVGVFMTGMFSISAWLSRRIRLRGIKKEGEIICPGCKGRGVVLPDEVVRHKQEHPSSGEVGDGLFFTGTWGSELVATGACGQGHWDRADTKEKPPTEEDASNAGCVWAFDTSELVGERCVMWTEVVGNPYRYPVWWRLPTLLLDERTSMRITYRDYLYDLREEGEDVE